MRIDYVSAGSCVRNRIDRNSKLYIRQEKQVIMRKLALPEEILLSIQQPARYIGGEVNMVKKDPSTVDIRFAMCFPDVFAK